MYTMNEENKKNNGKVLYISGYGDDENETILHALTMPVTIAAFIHHNGHGTIEFYETAEDDGVDLPVCQTGFIPEATPPVRMTELVKDLFLEENISKTVAGWIAIYMRDGVFCTDSEKQTFVSNLDLRDIAERIERNLDNVYNKYRNKYS